MDEDGHVAGTFLPIGESFGERSHLPIVFGGVFAVLYGLLACVFAFDWFAHDHFDAIWFIGMVGTPSSLIGSGIGKSISAIVFPQHRLSVEVILMICLGLLQYYGIGYFCGWLLARLRKWAAEQTT